MNRQRSKTSSKALWYGSGDKYIKAILLRLILYSEMMSEAVGGGAFKEEQSRAAAAHRDWHTVTMDCFEAPRMGLNLIFIKVSAAPTGALGPWKVEEP